MVKIAIDAGHGLNTPGKRTPDDEREWRFNNKVALACMAKLKTFENVQLFRVDDPSGKTDTPLAARTNQANQWKADVYVSFHHNALYSDGRWHSGGGVETYTMDHPRANPVSPKIAAAVHPKVVKAMGLRDRGVKKNNFHVLRETKMPAILVEGGFMDSTVDIKALRDDKRLTAQGEAIAEGLAEYFKLQPKQKQEVSPGKKQYRLLTGTFQVKADAEKAADALKKQFGWVVYVQEEDKL